ncbi:UDP-GlcNAc:betaGal beta-1,3-N-acetylglucosaminyltransferase-like protein 1 isoform X2 [Mauremys mutica]|uniref:UDP-GlcNAc:betaGal beta-1,3-N-acetylglucosaminyltransferase-like protein 1 isoform X2 n=1 Tax=Mauremys mutica TaxID=74926 RepID=UPI001D16B822|nr:UDP-GlcNAc:betaGal beta-1,3-N-acetylglucosaminyltransferase-like protein 1 isoform X2 [Mauremys mutica]
MEAGMKLLFSCSGAVQGPLLQLTGCTPLVVYFIPLPRACLMCVQGVRKREMSEEVGASRSPSSAAGGQVPFVHEELCDCDSVPAKCKCPAAPSPPVPDNPQLQSRASLDSIIGEGCRIQVSVILPVHNSECWLDECLKSVVEQDFEGTMELSAFNDASKDNSINIIEKWKLKLEDVGIRVVIGGHDSPQPQGVGFAKNQAVIQSSGTYLCFLDSVFTSHGPTVIMPTWFCSREWFCHVGKFDEGGKGVPEDLLFFYDHIRKGGGVFRVDQCLLQYRYHPQAATHSVLEETIWNHRVRFLEDRALKHWTSFTIWNAGKQGRKLYRSLSPANQKKVAAFCDVDENKIAKGFYTYQESKERRKPQIPIQHFKDATPPFIICVKLDLTGGGFEENLATLDLKEGLDYYHFN